MRRPSGSANGARRVRRQTRDRAQERHEQDVRVRQARRGIAGHAEERRAADERERRRLAGLDGDAMKDHLAACRDGVDDEIAVADRTAAGEHDQVRCARTRRAPARSASTVSCAAGCGSGTPPCADDDRAEREAVDVVDVPRRQRLPGFDDLIARRQNRDPRLREHVDVDAADGGERADAARRERGRPARITRSPAAMSAPRLPMFCPAAAAAKISIVTVVASSPSPRPSPPRRRRPAAARRWRSRRTCRAVTTASTTSGQCRCDRAGAARAGAARDAPLVSAATTA